MPARTQDISGLLDIAQNLYEAVMVISRRARQINNEMYQRKRDRQIMEELDGGFEEEFMHAADPEEVETEATVVDEENPITHAQREFKDGKLDYYYDTVETA